MTPSTKTITITHIVEDETPLPKLIAAWRWWLLPALIALVLALVYTDPFIGDWDGLDYTVGAVNGSPSTMALGRLLFIFANHALWLVAHALFHLRADQAYLLFKYGVVTQSPLAVIACWTLARDLTRSTYTATVAALLVAVSPVFVIYSGQEMTDVPSVLLVTLALIIHLRGLTSRRMWMVLLGAALLGLAANVRETAAFYAPLLAIAPFFYGWKLRPREIAWTLLACLVFVFMAFAPFAVWYAMDLSGYRVAWHGWVASMRAEVALHPVELRNLLKYVVFFLALSPLAVVAFPVAAWNEWRERGMSPLLLTALAGLFANFLLFFNYSTVINWRYFLTGLPALVPISADYFMRSQIKMLGNVRRAFWSVIAGIALITTLCGMFLRPISSEYIKKRIQTRDYRERLQLLPRDAIVMAGGQTIAVNYWQGIGAGEWHTIGTGSGWPGDKLVSEIEGYLNQGRRVFLDADAKWWSPCGWQKSETRAITTIEAYFRFRRVTETIFEIRPKTDTSANDAPHLERLLPENRPAELKECPALDKESN